MKVVDAVVYRELIFFPIKGKRSFSYSVSISPDQRSQISFGVLIFIERIIAQHNVAGFSIFVGNFKRYDGTAICHDPSLGSITVLERIDLNALAIGRSKRCLCDLWFRLGVSCKSDHQHNDKTWNDGPAP